MLSLSFSSISLPALPFSPSSAGATRGEFYRLILITSGVLALCSWLADFSASGERIRLRACRRSAHAHRLWTLALSEAADLPDSGRAAGIAYIILPVARA